MKLKILFMSLLISTGCFAAGKADVVVRTDTSDATISRHIYGQFSEHLGQCIYGGIWVGENSPIPNINGYRKDLVDALKKIKVPNLRWPGGCFADEYHWRDGVGPRTERPKMINTHWGGVVEDNSFGTNEFLNYCELVGTEPYICGNVGSGTVEEMSKWVEYMTFDGESPMSKLRKENGREKPWKVTLFGIGNENWGCGGDMHAEHYADLYRNFAVYCRNYGDNQLKKIAGGANSDDYNWTEVMMKKVGPGKMWGLSLHNYTIPKGWGPEGKGSATKFGENEYFAQMKKTVYMDELVTKHTNIMDKYDSRKQVAFCVDEWGAWYDVEPGTNPGFLYQQNTLRDAILCAATINIFHKHADRVRLANIAQMVNVLQSIVLTKDEKILLTPTYHIYDMYKVHQDAANLPVEILSPNYTFGTESVPALSVSASKDKQGAIHISIVNMDPKNDIETSCNLVGAIGKAVSGQILTAGDVKAFNTFEQPNNVVLAAYNGAKLDKGVLKLKVPAKSVITVEIK